MIWPPLLLPSVKTELYTSTHASSWKPGRAARFPSQIVQKPLPIRTNFLPDFRGFKERSCFGGFKCFLASKKQSFVTPGLQVRIIQNQWINMFFLLRSLPGTNDRENENEGKAASSLVAGPGRSNVQCTQGYKKKKYPAKITLFM